MPKIVDHDHRRAELAAAVWRVIARDGVEAASVRQVAEEAGLSPGSLRHFFTTHAQLMRFAMELVGQRLEERLVETRARPGLTPVERVTLMVEQMLPLDDERRLECRVWLGFVTRSLVDPDLLPVQQDLDRRLASAFGVMISVLVDAGALRQDLDPMSEAERLYALVDGLIIHGLVRGSEDPRRGVVGVHLRDITEEV